MSYKMKKEEVKLIFKKKKMKAFIFGIGIIRTPLTLDIAKWFFLSLLSSKLKQLDLFKCLNTQVHNVI